MLTYEFSGSFKKDLKLMEKRRKNMVRLREVMAMIIHEESLPPERRNHPLHGNWAGTLECHIQNNWLLIYEGASLNPVHCGKNFFVHQADGNVHFFT
jgi:mRNA interferase YafQ